MKDGRLKEGDEQDEQDEQEEQDQQDQAGGRSKLGAYEDSKVQFSTKYVPSVQANVGP
jgi:hypothetical protein